MEVCKHVDCSAVTTVVISHSVHNVELLPVTTSNIRTLAFPCALKMCLLSLSLKSACLYRVFQKELYKFESL
jgi:hypothetical protein